MASTEAAQKAIGAGGGMPKDELLQRFIVDAQALQSRIKLSVWFDCAPGLLPGTKEKCSMVLIAEELLAINMHEGQMQPAMSLPGVAECDFPPQTLARSGNRLLRPGLCGMFYGVS